MGELNSKIDAAVERLKTAAGMAEHYTCAPLHIMISGGKGYTWGGEDRECYQKQTNRN